MVPRLIDERRVKLETTPETSKKEEKVSVDHTIRGHIIKRRSKGTEESGKTADKGNL